MTIPRDVIVAGPEAIALYRRAIRKGASPAFAEMLALRAPPGANTDTTFLAGRGTLQDQFRGDEQVLDQITAIAQANGYKPNANDVYLSRLAAFPGDPKGFVPATGAKSHVKQVCEERNMNCDGSVKHKRDNSRPQQADIPLGDDLVEKNVKQMVAKDPSLSKLSTEDLKAEAIARHGKQKPPV